MLICNHLRTTYLAVILTRLNTASEHIPQYFQNKEIPAICYFYKKPLRNLIFKDSSVYAYSSVKLRLFKF